MSLWGKALALFLAAVVAVVFLKMLPPLVVLALFAGGVIYANHVLTVRPKREARGAAVLPGFRSAPEVQVELTSYPLALLVRSTAGMFDVVTGRWRGIDVRIFDLDVGPAAPEAGFGVRRFTCVLAPLPFVSPHLVVEPRVFLTPEDERPNLPTAPVPSDRVSASYDVRCQDPSLAASFIGERLTAWLLEHEDRVAFELRGPVVLLYAPRVPEKDRDRVLELLQGFMDAIPARRRVEP